MQLINIDEKMLEFDLGWKIFLAIMAGETYASQQKKYGLTRNEPKRLYCEILDAIYNELKEQNTASLDSSKDSDLVEGIDFEGMEQREYAWYQKNLVAIVQIRKEFRAHYKGGLEAKNSLRVQKQEHKKDQKAKSLLIFGKMDPAERKRRKQMLIDLRARVRDAVNFYTDMITKNYNSIEHYMRAEHIVVGYDQAHAVAKFDEAVQFLSMAVEMDKRRFGLLRHYQQCDFTKVGEVAAISNRSVLNSLTLNSGWVTDMLAEQLLEDTLRSSTQSL